MKHILTILFLAIATTASAESDCLLIGKGMSAVETLREQGLSRKQAFDLLVSIPSETLSRSDREDLIEPWMTWVYDSNATAKQWNALCLATE